MAFDVLVRSLFTDSGAAAGLAKLNSQIRDVEKAAPGGTRGFNAIERGMQSLAAQAVGLQGPIGKIAEGLVKFGGGSALVLGVTAGIGLIAGAYALFTANTREAQKAQDDFLTSLEKLGPRAAALAARGKVAQLQGKLGQSQSFGEVASQFLSDITGGLAGTDRTEQQQRILRQIATLQLDIGKNERDAGQSAEDRRKKIEEQNEALVAQRYAMKELVRVSDELASAQGFMLGVTPGLVAQIPTYQRNQQIDAAGSKLLADEISTRLIGIGRGQTAGPVGQQATKGQGFDARLAAESVAFLGALQGGGAGGILSTGGALLSSIKGIPGPVGLAVSLVGSAFSLFDHSAERRQQQMMDELRRIRQNTDKRGQPDHTSITIMLNGKEVSGALVDDVIYQINRMSRRDATPRLPSR